MSRKIVEVSGKTTGKNRDYGGEMRAQIDNGCPIIPRKNLALPHWERYNKAMRIIAKSRLRQYWEKSGNEKSQPYLNEWYHFCAKKDWATPQDVKNTFRHASFVSNNRVVFNVKGNDYRVVCAMDYPRQAMYIKFVGTHDEYDAINVEEVK